MSRLIQKAIWSESYFVENDDLQDLIAHEQKRTYNLTVLFSKIIKGRSICPSEIDLRRLAKKLNLFRDSVRFSQGPGADVTELRKRVGRAVTLLEQDIPLLYCELRQRNAGTRADWVRTRLTSQNFLVVKRLEQALEAFKASDLFDQQEVVAECDRWKLAANRLADLFRETMRRSNPGKEFRNSREGPVNAFVRALLPEILGESGHKESETIYVHFRTTKAGPGI